MCLGPLCDWCILECGVRLESSYVDGTLTDIHVVNCTLPPSPPHPPPRLRAPLEVVDISECSTSANVECEMTGTEEDDETPTEQGL